MTTEAAVSRYSIDAMHSTAEFSVKHLMLSTVKGRFKQLDGKIYLDEADPSRSSVEATIDVASIDTGVDMRDNDLRSDNFFAADRFPTIRFESKSVERVDDDNWRVRGDLTIRDVVLDTEFEGRGKGFQGEERLGFTAQTTLNRHDFGLSYNAVLETGGVVVGDKVKVTLHIEAVKQD